MEYGITLIGGIVGVCFLMLYLMNSLGDEKHFILKLVLLFWVVAVVLLIPKVALDANTICETVVANSTDVSASVTSYEYESFCYDRAEGTAGSFYKQTTVLYYLILGYAIVYIAIWAMKWLMDSVKKRRGG